MSTEQLESFIQVVENLNFARAAEALNITQSAVSRQIHALEEELGTKLLHRTTRIVTLTPAGISFFEDAKNIMERLRIAAAKIHCHQASNIQIISIGCGTEAVLDLLCEILKPCREQFPELYPFLRIIPHRVLLSLFYQGELDLLFSFRDDIPLKDKLIYKELFSLPLCCVLPSTHPYSTKEVLEEEELLSENMIVCNSYAIPSKAAEIQNRISQKLPPEQSYLCDNLQVLLTLVKAGYGCSILPKASFASSDIRYVPLKNTEPLSYGIFYKNGSLTELHKKLISIIKETVANIIIE